MSNNEEQRTVEEELKELRDDYDQLLKEYKKQQIQLNNMQRAQSPTPFRAKAFLKKGIKEALKKNPKIDYYSKRLIKKLKAKR